MQVANCSPCLAPSPGFLRASSMLSIVAAAAPLTQPCSNAATESKRAIQIGILIGIGQLGGIIGSKYVVSRNSSGT